MFKLKAIRKLFTTNSSEETAPFEIAATQTNGKSSLAKQSVATQPVIDPIENYKTHFEAFRKLIPETKKALGKDNYNYILVQNLAYYEFQYFLMLMSYNKTMELPIVPVEFFTNWRDSKYYEDLRAFRFGYWVRCKNAKGEDTSVFRKGVFSDVKFATYESSLEQAFDFQPCID